MPADYVRKQTLTTGERYITPELKELELAISTAQSRQQRLEERLYASLRRDASRQNVEGLLAAADALAELDVFGRAGAGRGRARLRAPGLRRSEHASTIDDGRHPVMEALRGRRVRAQRPAPEPKQRAASCS